MKEFNQTYNDALSAVSDLKRATSHDYKLFDARRYRKQFQRVAEFVNDPDTGNPVQVVYMTGIVVFFYNTSETTYNVSKYVRAVATIGKNDNGGVKMRLCIAD